MKKLLLYSVFISLVMGCAAKKRTKTTQTTPNEYSKEAAITGQSKFLDHGASLKIFLELDIRRLYDEATPVEKMVSQFGLAYLVAADYNSNERITSSAVALTPEMIKQRDRKMLVAFEVPKPASVTSGVMFLELTDKTTGQKLVLDVPLRFASNKFGDQFTLFDRSGNAPLFRNYFYPNDTFQVRSVDNTAKTLYVYRYAHEFEAAFSPMAVSTRSVKKNMEIDSTFQIQTNTPVAFDRQALYYIVEDTNSTYGIGLVGVNNRYPRYTRPEQLTKPLVYMSTNDEIKELTNPQDPKKTLDKYWLRLMSGNQALAKRVIKSYYRRVEQANQQFTSYKEGWKTDMGMVFIVFGPPNKVQRTKDREIWTYTQSANFSEINFTFMKRPNQFTEDHYELVRYVEYEPIWYPTVEEWRTGLVER